MHILSSLLATLNILSRDSVISDKEVSDGVGDRYPRRRLLGWQWSIGRAHKCSVQ